MAIAELRSRSLKENKKLESALNILTPKMTPTEEALAKVDIAEKLKKIRSVEDRRSYLESLLLNLPAYMRNVVTTDHNIMKLMKKETNESEDCQKIITESELEEWIAKGWKFVSVSPSGKESSS